MIYSNTLLPVDLYNMTGAALHENGSYNGYVFTKQAIKYIKEHSINYPNRPFFLYFALHNTHEPNEAPSNYVNLYNFNQTLRNKFDGMVSVVDESVKNVSSTLKETSNYWNNTIFVWTSDNGAWSIAGGSNKPYRGSKTSNWEGGVKVPALISGGIIPQNRKGKSLNGLFHIADFYSTFCGLAGIDANDSGTNNPNANSPTDSIS